MDSGKNAVNMDVDMADNASPATPLKNGAASHTGEENDGKVPVTITHRDVEILATAFMCQKADSATGNTNMLDMEKFMGLAGFGTKESATTCISRMKKKLKQVIDNMDEGDTMQLPAIGKGPGTPGSKATPRKRVAAKASASGEGQSGEQAAKPKPKRARKSAPAPAGDDSDADAEVSPLHPKPKLARKPAQKKTQASQAEEGAVADGKAKEENNVA